jgi:hypothetical protein
VGLLLLHLHLLVHLLHLLHLRLHLCRLLLLPGQELCSRHLAGGLCGLLVVCLPGCSRLSDGCCCSWGVGAAPRARHVAGPTGGQALARQLGDTQPICPATPCL